MLSVVQRILALVTSASVLFAGVHCACAAAAVAVSQVAAPHDPPAVEAQPPHVQSCCKTRSPAGPTQREAAPCHQPEREHSDCPHCQSTIVADTTATSSPIAGFGLTSTLDGHLDAAAFPAPATAPGASVVGQHGGLPPPSQGGGRSLLRLHCTLLN